MSNNKTIYFPGLNGLRAIAAISVLIGHITSTTFINFNFNLPPISIGEHGVTLFFVISGFLITYLLLIEKEKTNNIDVKKFYFRRILRIWPIYYLFIAIGIILSFYISDIKDIQSKNILWYIFLSANFALVLNETVRFIIHYWSIGVEEQFYMFWPWFIKFDIKRITIKLLSIIFLLFILKSAFWYFGGNKFILYKILSTTRFHCMLIGAIGAIWYYNKQSFFLQISTHKTTQILSWVLFTIIFIGLIEFPAPLASEFISVLSLFLIMGQINTNRLINLDTKIFDFIGKISYGIYVIHPLIIIFYSIIFKNMNLSYFSQTLVVYSTILSTTILVSYLSFAYFEKPFVRLKSKYTVVQSQSSKITLK